MTTIGMAKVTTARALATQSWRGVPVIASQRMGSRRMTVMPDAEPPAPAPAASWSNPANGNRR